MIVPAFLLSRFVRDIAGRAVLVIFLFAAAGAYFAFATLGREVADARPIWTLVELLQVVVFGAVARLARLSLLAGCGMGLASTLGRRLALLNSIRPSLVHRRVHWVRSVSSGVYQLSRDQGLVSGCLR